MEPLWRDFTKTLATKLVIVAGLASTAATFVLWPRQLYWTLPLIWGIVITTGSFLVCQQSRKRIRELEEQVDQLQLKPYIIEHKTMAEQKLESLTPQQKQLVKYLLHNGRTERTQITQEFKLAQNQISALIAAVNYVGILDLEHGSGTLRYCQVKPEWTEVLRDLLHER